MKRVQVVQNSKFETLKILQKIEFLIISILISSFHKGVTIQFVSVSAEETTDSLVGVWTNPDITNDIGDYCCVPTSITIKVDATKSYTSYTATYKFPGFGKAGWSEKCDMLFTAKADGGSLDLYQKSDSEDWNSDVTVREEKMYFHSYGSVLRVYNQPRDTKVFIDQCDFNSFVMGRTGIALKKLDF